jgi:hypothetical protein
VTNVREARDDAGVTVTCFSFSSRVRVRRVARATALLALIFSSAPGWSAEPASSAQCASAYEDVQLLRQRGKLVAARDHAGVCARDQCPDVARHDCARWAEELAREVPSVVVVVRDEADHDVPADRVFVDGALRAEISAGRAFDLDPGAHVFRIERTGLPPVERSYTVYQGERDRVLRITVPSPLAPAIRPPTSVPPPIAAKPPALPTRAPPSYAPAIVVASVSVVAYGVSAYLGVTGRDELSGLRTSCAPGCTDAQVDPVRTRLTFSDVSLGIGVVGTAVAIYLFARTAGERASISASAAATARFELIPMRDGAAALVGGRF